MTSSARRSLLIRAAQFFELEFAVREFISRPVIAKAGSVGDKAL